MTKNYKFVLQENMYDCGVAALKTIFLQYGKKIKSNDVVRKTTSQGTTAYELISSSKKLGLNAKGVRTTLDALTIKHLPCIAHIIKDKNYFHYIVIFEKNNKNKTLVILDPAIGIKTITYEEFNEETTNIFILFDDKKMQKEKDKRFKNVIKSLLKINKNIIIKSILLSIFYIIMTILFNYYFKVILEKLELNNVLVYSFIIFLLIVLLKNIIYNLKNKTFLKLNMRIDKTITNNLIMCNKEKLMNPNAFQLGVPGSGKSFLTKEQIVFLALATQDDIIICDPEAEYSLLVKELGGEVITIAAGSENHINAMDMLEGYGDSGNPIGDKSQFIMSLFEQLDRDGIKPVDRSIIDRCVTLVFQDYYRTREMPTLVTLREKLIEQPEIEARSLALKLELFTDGSLDAFAHQTNVNTSSRIVSYDIFKLGKQLKTMGLLVITDAMINRVNENWRKGKRTHIILDEFHVVFENEESASFFNSAWRQFRKRDGYPIGITQNVEYLLDSVQASTMLSNSEFVVMLNQSYQDREKLAKLLNISDEQLSYITNAQSGCGLIKYGGNIVPFINRFPKNTLLYKLMSTKPSEKNK